MKTETIFRSVEEWKHDAGVVEDDRRSVTRRVSDRPNVFETNEQERELDAELCATASDRHPEWYIG